MNIKTELMLEYEMKQYIILDIPKFIKLNLMLLDILVIWILLDPPPTNLYLI